MFANIGDENAVPGLKLLSNYLTEAEADALLNLVDAESWSEELARRVQHHGWRYDYRAGRIDTSMRLGPLPDWASVLSGRWRRRVTSKEPQTR